MIGGEALPSSLADELRGASGADITNMYGPTETTIWSSTRPAVGEGIVPLGKPIANTQFFVLDEAGAQCPIGAEGELCIGGTGVTDGGRMYRTGDLVRYTAEGELEFIGRVDNQIKLRGYRIELGEIENALQGEAGVTQCVVVAREETPGDVRLIGYVTGRGLACAYGAICRGRSGRVSFDAKQEGRSQRIAGTSRCQNGGSCRAWFRSKR